MRQTNTQTKPSHKALPDSREGWHYVKVQKSDANYEGPMTTMLDARSYADPSKPLYVKAYDGDKPEDRSRTGSKRMVILKMTDADYRHMLRTNDADARGLQAETDYDEEIKRVPQAI